MLGKFVRRNSIHGHRTALGDLDAQFLQAESRDVGFATERDQDLVTLQAYLAVHGVALHNLGVSLAVGIRSRRGDR